MTKLRRDDPGPRRERTADERERERLDREARRTGAGMPRDTMAPSEPLPVPPHPAAPPLHSVPPEPVSAPPPQRAPPEPASPLPEPVTPIRRIQPEPPAPPAAAAGALRDETEHPLGVRWARRIASRRTHVTPPADVPRGPARARRSVVKRIAALLALLVALALIIGLIKVFQPFAGAAGGPVSVAIPQGASASTIGDRLAAAGVVDSGTIFNIRAALAGKRGDLRSGTFTLRKHMTYGAALDALTATRAVTKGATLAVTIPEGRSRDEIGPIAASAGLSGSYARASRRFSGALNPYRYDAPKRTRSLEGFLFPDTYELKQGATARDLVVDQLGTFEKKFASVSLRYARSRHLTAYDVLIIASMIDREARTAHDRPLIAAVIYNRLKDGTPLGIDATIRYALHKPSGALTNADLAIDSPYNSRRRANLPPTPIGNPGLASIQAAARPARVGYRYFVVKPGTCGEHVFATTLAEHNRNVARYGAARAKAGNRSPTSC